MSNLTIKQENFCLAYIETGNASEAYRRAYNAKKSKPETINRTAKELLDNPKIAARVTELKNRIAKKVEISQERVLEELSAMAFYDPADLVVPDPDNPGEEHRQPEGYSLAAGADSALHYWLELGSKRKFRVEAGQQDAKR